MIDKLFEYCFDQNKQNNVLLTYLPTALQSLCDSNPNKKFIGNMLEVVLKEHYKLQDYLEDNRFSVDCYQSKCRACIWNILEKCANYVISFNQKVSDTLPLGIFCPPISKLVPMICDVPLVEHSEII